MAIAAKKKITSQKDLEAQIAAGVPPQRIDVPTYYVATLQAAQVGNDMNLVFSRPHPVMIGETQAAINDPILVLNLSMGTVKDMTLLLQDQVALYEAQFGEITTAYTQRRKADEPAAAPKRPARKIKLNG